VPEYVEGLRKAKETKVEKPGLWAII
jgi:hypothetical protein